MRQAIRPLTVAVLIACAAAAFAAAPKAPPRNFSANQPGAPQGGTVEGGIVQFGEAVEVPADTEVQGSVVLLGGSAQILGHVKDDVVVLGGGTFINGTVDGSVFILGKTLQLGPNAVIRGDLTTMGTLVSRADGALVNGQTLASQGLRLGILGTLAAFLGFLALLLFWLKIFASFGWALLAVLLAALLPDAIEDTAETLAARPFSSVAVGVLLWPASLLILATLLVSLIGILLIPLQLMALAALGIWGFVTVAFLLGDRLFRAMQMYVQPWLSCLLGIAVLQGLHWVPYLGSWVTGVAMIFGVGAGGLTILLASLARRRLPTSEVLG